jgi:exopolysaccharide biosynthesis polyprenyl glycosylphosphotransferase
MIGADPNGRDVRTPMLSQAGRRLARFRRKVTGGLPGRSASSPPTDTGAAPRGAASIPERPPISGELVTSVPSRPSQAPEIEFPGPHAKVNGRFGHLPGFARRESRRIAEGLTPAPTRSRDAVYRRLLACADVVAAGTAIMLSIAVLGDHDHVALSTVAALPLVVAVSKVIGLYDRDELVLHKSTLDEAPALFHQATLFTVVIWLLQDVLIDGHLGRKQVLALWGALLACAMMARTAARLLARHSTETERCMVVGDRTAALQLAEKLSLGDSIQAEVVCHIPFREPGTDHASADVKLSRLVRDEAIDRVIIAPRSVSDSDAALDATRDAKALGVKVSVVPRICEVVGSSVEFDDVYGLTMLAVRQFRFSRSSLVLKRSLDLVGSSLLLVATAPAMAFITLVIRLDSCGPAFFSQARIGRDGRSFQMLKFRTMVAGADGQKASLRHLNEAEGLFKIADDPRITRVGRFLRRTTLDELPQLINVLRGEMSLVGPRPLVAEDDRQIEGWHRQRLQLTPGMTGHWQILGSSRVPLRDMVAIDYLYVANWSLWTDVKILLRTIPYVLGARGL